MITLLLYLILFILIVLTIGLFVTLLIVIYFATRGAPYARTDPETLKQMISVSGIKKGEKIVDIGSGDGTIVISFAQSGAEAHGFEFNPVLVYLSRRKIRKLGLEKKAFIHLADFWRKNYSEFDVIVVYGIFYIMERLEKKLKKEIKPTARVLTNHFAFPTWKPNKKQGRVSLYKR